MCDLTVLINDTDMSEAMEESNVECGTAAHWFATNTFLLNTISTVWLIFFWAAGKISLYLFSFHSQLI